jgi:hypothetical protein
MTRKKLLNMIKTNINHHVKNDHQYKPHHVCKDKIGTYIGERYPTDLSKDALLDMILNHLGLEVCFERTRRIYLKPKEKDTNENQD